MSLDTRISTDGSEDTVLGDFVPYQGPSPEDILEESYTRDLLVKYIEKLSPREQIVINMRYGFVGNGDSRTLEDIGSEFGITRERVRQIESKALRKLRYYMSRDKIQFE